MKENAAVDAIPLRATLEAKIVVYAPFSIMTVMIVLLFQFTYSIPLSRDNLDWTLDDTENH